MHSNPTPNMSTSPAAFVQVIDPANRTGKIQVPLEATFETVGRTEWLNNGGNGAKKDVSLCMLFQQRKCNAGQKCNQIHADRVFIQDLRRQAETLPRCCPVHGDIHSFGDPVYTMKLAQFRYVRLQLQSGASITLSPSAFGRTPPYEGLLGKPEGFVTVSVSRICRLHQRNCCKYGKDCKNIHICRELGKYVIEGQHPPAELLAQFECRQPQLTSPQAAGLTSPPAFPLVRSPPVAMVPALPVVVNSNDVSPAQLPVMCVQHQPSAFALSPHSCTPPQTPNSNSSGATGSRRSSVQSNPSGGRVSVSPTCIPSLPVRRGDIPVIPQHHPVQFHPKSAPQQQQHHQLRLQQPPVLQPPASPQEESLSLDGSAKFGHGYTATESGLKVFQAAFGPQEEEQKHHPAQFRPKPVAQQQLQQQKRHVRKPKKEKKMNFNSSCGSDMFGDSFAKIALPHVQDLIE